MDAMVLFNEGERCLEAGEYEKGVGCFSSALDICDLTGQVGSRMEDRKEPLDRSLSGIIPEEHSQDRYELLRDKAHLLLYRGSAYMMMDRVVEAESDLNTAIDLMPYYWPALLERGLCHLEMGDVLLAEEDIKLAIHRAMGHPEEMSGDGDDDSSQDDMIKALMTGLCGFPALHLNNREINRVRSLLKDVFTPVGSMMFNPIPETLFHMACMDKDREIRDRL